MERERERERESWIARGGTSTVSAAINGELYISSDRAAFKRRTPLVIVDFFFLVQRTSVCFFFLFFFFFFFFFKSYASTGKAGG